MGVLTIDTFAAVTRLKGAGFTETQAKEIIDTFKDVDISQVATKFDLSEVKTELIKWLVGMSFAQIAAIVTLIKIIPVVH